MLKNGRQLLICRHYSVDDIYVIIFHVIASTAHTTDQPRILLTDHSCYCSTKLTTAQPSLR